jgi:DNA-binding response OmpR family regulator
MAALDEHIVIYMGRSQANIDVIQQAIQILSKPQPGAINGESQGYTVRMQVVNTQREAQNALRVDLPDLFIMETNTKQESRIDFCLRLRTIAPHTSIITTGTKRPRKRSAYDHFLRMPLTPDGVATLMGHMLEEKRQHLLRMGDFTLHTSRRVVECPNGRQRLTPKLAQLLALLMSRGEQVTPRHMIMREVWNIKSIKDTRTLDVHIRWLREIIEPDPSDPARVVTVRGKGYQFKSEIEA